MRTFRLAACLLMAVAILMAGCSSHEDAGITIAVAINGKAAGGFAVSSGVETNMAARTLYLGTKTDLGQMWEVTQVSGNITGVSFDPGVSDTGGKVPSTKMTLTGTGMVVVRVTVFEIGGLLTASDTVPIWVVSSSSSTSAAIAGNG